MREKERIKSDSVCVCVCVRERERERDVGVERLAGFYFQLVEVWTPKNDVMSRENPTSFCNTCYQCSTTLKHTRLLKWSRVFIVEVLPLFIVTR